MARKDEKTNQILEAATKEFHLKGFDSASMHNISELAQVSKRTLYKYFPTKDALYDALIDEILDRIQGMYDFNFDPDTPIKDQIEKIIETKMELTLSDSFLKLSRIVMGELLKSRTPTEEQLLRINNSELLFINWLSKAKDHGMIKSDLEVEDIANQFHSIMKGNIYWPILLGLKEKDELDLEKIKSTTINFFMNSFC